MRRSHFDLLRPVCPVCRQGALAVGRVEREAAGQILEGILLCPHSSCQREYPILDGIPILVGPIRDYIASQLPAISARSDFSESTESLLGDCTGPGSEFDARRQQQSSYAWDHYGQFDPQGSPGEPPPGGISRLLKRGLELLPGAQLPAGTVLDLGCGPGRTTFDLAARLNRPVLGIDLNLSLLKLGGELLHTGRLRYPRRKVGLVYERREFNVPCEAANLVDFWACDASALPLASGSAALVIALNLLDSTSSPLALLESIAAMLAPGGNAILACPYDWSQAATPLEQWLGGHSQRGAAQGDSAALVRKLLTPGAHPQSIAGLRIVAELDRLPWHVRLHERSVVQYQTHLIVAERLAG